MHANRLRDGRRQARDAARDFLAMSDRPFSRATITPESVILNPWRPSLIRGGPGMPTLGALRRRRLILADLRSSTMATCSCRSFRVMRGARGAREAAAGVAGDRWLSTSVAR